MTKTLPKLRVSYQKPNQTTALMSPADDVPPDLTRLLKAWQAGRSAKTQSAYLADVKQFLIWLNGKRERGNPVELWDAFLAGGAGRANETMARWVGDMESVGRSSATIARRLSALGSLVRLARSLGVINWKLDVKAPRVEKVRDTRGCGRDAVKRILKEAERQESPRKRKRDVAVVRLLFDCALRRGEVTGLRVGDVDVAGGRVFIIGKGRRERSPVTLPPATMASVSEWLEARPVSETDALFVSLPRSRRFMALTGLAVYRLIKRLGERAGVQARPHGLRHSAITYALDVSRGDLRKVARFSRHRDIKTLAIYDDNREDLGGAMAARVAL